MTGPAGAELLVFGREPRPGAAKTRLIPALGPDGAARLYRALLTRTLLTGSRATVARRSLWLDTWLAHSELRLQAARQGYLLEQQTGADLGARMAQAFETALARSACAVLIGSDCADFSAAYLAEALAELAHQDVVIGPAADGGYLLIGLNRPCRPLFERIDWGTSAVLEQTRQRLRSMHLRWTELRTLRDIDEPQDLDALPETLKQLVAPER